MLIRVSFCLVHDMPVPSGNAIFLISQLDTLIEELLATFSAFLNFMPLILLYAQNGLQVAAPHGIHEVRLFSSCHQLSVSSRVSKVSLVYPAFHP